MIIVSKYSYISLKGENVISRAHTKKIVLAILIFALNVLFAQKMITLEFYRDHLKFSHYQAYDIIRYDDYELINQPGCPALPFLMYQYQLPANQNIDTIEVEILKADTLEGAYQIIPGSEQYILSRNIKYGKLSKSAIYNQNKPYPEKIVKNKGCGYLSGRKIASLQIYPLIYNPHQKKVVLIEKLEITIHEKQTGIGLQKKNLTSENLNLKQYYKNIDFLQDRELESRFNQENYHPYLIITSEDLSSDFKRLEIWKRQKGLNPKIITTDEISENYNGKDLPAKIRNFIIYARNSWRTKWLLLGGDTDIIPARYAYAFDCQANGPADANDIPCDLYYSDLDGNWNQDGDNIYGEVEDSVDMYPDVFVGRAPVENSREASAFVDKLLKYEKQPEPRRILDMLFLAMILWGDPYTDSAISKDYIDSIYVPPRFSPVIKLYESKGKGYADYVVNRINEGVNIINHNGHAWYTSMGVGHYEYLHNDDMDNLGNQDIFPILYSIGCWPAAFDRECIAEHFLNNPDGGGVAFIGNSRYGWGSPGNPLFGYSDRFDRAFFKNLLQRDIVQSGATLAATKAQYIPLSRQENVYRWCQYELNLLGDPEMPVWTEKPRDFIVDYPDSIPSGECGFTITVSNKTKLTEDALICIMQEKGVYSSGYSDQKGQKYFDVDTEKMDSLLLTITKPNYIPFQTKIPVSTNKPYVQVESIQHDPVFSTTPGRVIGLDLQIRNEGNQFINEVRGSLASGTAGVEMLDSTYTIRDIKKGETVVVKDSISFVVNRIFKNKDNIVFNHKWQAAQNSKGQDQIIINVKAPEPEYIDHYVNYRPEQFWSSLHIITINSGRMEFDGDLEIINETPDIVFKDSIRSITKLLPDNRDTNSFDFHLKDSLKLPAFPRIKINFSTYNQYVKTDSFRLELGHYGFSDNLEKGDGKWIIQDSLNIWHLSTEKSFSGNYSWHPGFRNKSGYPNRLDSNYVESQAILVGPNPELSFMAWYEFPNYGTDGMYVRIKTGDDKWITLDFIGSGGALGALPTWNDWYEYTYDLEDYLTPGEETRIRFSMQSDKADSTAGIFLDEIQISGKSEDSIFSKINEGLNKPDRFKLFSNYPNPFNFSTNFHFYLPEQSNIKIQIYNLKGEKVESIMKEGASSGLQTINWRGNYLSSGVYLYTVATERDIRAGKFVLLK
jgi:hypothetical protein